MAQNTSDITGIPATQRPSEDIIDRALRHIRNGIMAFARKGPGSLILPSGNGGQPHEVKRLPSGHLTCSCMAGQKGQACWAQTVYQMLAGLAADWPAAEAPHYRDVDEEQDDRPADTQPTTKRQVTRPEQPAAPSQPKPAAAASSRTRLTKKAKAAIEETAAALGESEILDPPAGRKVAWIGNSGFGIHINAIRAAREALGDEQARHDLEIALATTAHTGICAVCSQQLVPFSNGKNLACWDHGLVVPAPDRAEAAA